MSGQNRQAHKSVRAPFYHVLVCKGGRMAGVWVSCIGMVPLGELIYVHNQALHSSAVQN